MRLKPFFAALVVAVSLLAYTPAFTQPAQQGPTADPACVELCRWEVYDCIAAGGSEHRCGSLYRRCLAKCQH